MVDRGARHLTFLSRSGTSKTAAASHVQCLQKRGVNIEVVEGDVTSLDDVTHAVMKAKSPIGGVVHAAMALDVSIKYTQNLRFYLLNFPRRPFLSR